MHARDNPRQLYVSNKEGALMRLLRTGVVRMGDEARRRKKNDFTLNSLQPTGQLCAYIYALYQCYVFGWSRVRTKQTKNYVAKRFII